MSKKRTTKEIPISASVSASVKKGKMSPQTAFLPPTVFNEEKMNTILTEIGLEITPEQITNLLQIITQTHSVTTGQFNKNAHVIRLIINAIYEKYKSRTGLSKDCIQLELLLSKMYRDKKNIPIIFVFGHGLVFPNEKLMNSSGLLIHVGEGNDQKETFGDRVVTMSLKGQPTILPRGINPDNLKRRLFNEISKMSDGVIPGEELRQIGNKELFKSLKKTFSEEYKKEVDQTLAFQKANPGSYEGLLPENFDVVDIFTVSAYEYFKIFLFKSSSIDDDIRGLLYSKGEIFDYIIKQAMFGINIVSGFAGRQLLDMGNGTPLTEHIDLRTPVQYEGLISEKKMVVITSKTVLKNLLGSLLTNPLLMQIQTKNFFEEEMSEYEKKIFYGFSILVQLVQGFANPDPSDVEYVQRIHSMIDGITTIDGITFEQMSTALEKESISKQFAIGKLPVILLKTPSTQQQLLKEFKEKLKFIFEDKLLQWDNVGMQAILGILFERVDVVDLTCETLDCDVSCEELQKLRTVPQTESSQSQSVEYNFDLPSESKEVETSLQKKKIKKG